MWLYQDLKSSNTRTRYHEVTFETGEVSLMTTQPKICVVGSSMIDLISRVPRLPKLGETLVGHSFHLGYGGKGANQAVMAAKLGAQVTMVNKVGRDVFGEGTLKNYRNQGIDTTHVLFDESRFSGVAPIFVDDDAKNFIVIVPGANLGLLPADVQNAKQVILEADILICQLEIPIETTLEAFRIAKSGNVRTILNPAPAAPIPEELLQLSDICAPNETETELLTGQPVGTLAEAEAAARKLLSQGPGTVILTLGERGALLVDKDSVENLPAIKVAAVDPTGAGDAFVGSLAVFLGEGLPLRDAIRRANAVAALSVTRIGTQVSFPKRAEADDFLKQHGLM
jgi:ribokinase